MITFHIISIFPNAFDSYLNESILKRALEAKKIAVKFYNPRDHTLGAAKKTKNMASAKNSKNKNFAQDAVTQKYSDYRLDDKPYGGGPGMLLQAEPVARAITKALTAIKRKKSARTKIIFFAPLGTPLTTEYASHAAKKYTDIILVCGRYEGIDARLHSIFKMEDVSVGPFVVTGGELPAMLIIDTMARQVPGVLGSFDSREESRNASPRAYTRPEVIVWKGKKLRVPKVLLSGNHKLIEEWRTQERIKRLRT